ncbi:PepSY domain-containing protein [Methylosinus sp. Sm6]|uniref:PepSY-associated TM helix domain-containing protein n=1 Tax=Methylosinus sp. Sm6 TaxID=2866948 RepID=UPI001C998195|nr:PepSY-associated TM helix domain-containing protein [Methylosinus sp. Sm6]MBY6243214.1 PepSY domain-containing protein [Methylosinus sp. Sm6]
MSQNVLESKAARPGGAPAQGRLRRLWLDAHLYVGLVAGAVFVVIGLTGSILAFRVEIDAWLNKDLLVLAATPGAGAQKASLDDIIAHARAAAPAGAVPSYVHFSKRPDQPADVILRVGGEAHEGHDHEAIDQYLMNPYDASFIGRRAIVDATSHFAEPFVILVMHLHYTLLQGEIGETIVGFVGLFLFGSLASGVYLWWPRNGKWRQAFSIKRGASAERLVLDLHKTTAIYVLPILVVILFSGVYLIFGDKISAMVALASPVDAHMLPEALKSEPANGRAPIGAAAAATIMDRAFPDGLLMDMRLPVGPEDVYVVGKRADDEVNKSEPRRRAAIDQYSGRILWVQDPHDYTAGERFLEWQFPLHTGEAFGNPGRALICAMGFVPALLYATGLIRWLQKRRARRRSAT